MGGHLGVGVFDEEIHQDHDQDGDGDPEVPDDPAQLGADEGLEISGQVPCALWSPTSPGLCCPQGATSIKWAVPASCCFQPHPALLRGGRTLGMGWGSGIRRE